MNRKDLVLGDLKFTHEQVQDVGLNGVFDFEAHWRAKSAAGELAFESIQQVFGVIFFHFDVFVARHTEGVVLKDVHAGEKVL
ncbi:unannotated protein [freshwater metagenome]|uniref:Unannotated protein n=1 Tax=freshwater metagenome TaxID=449393 RepID=A0A6J6HUR5_9ZZZZ